MKLETNETNRGEIGQHQAHMPLLSLVCSIQVDKSHNQHLRQQLQANLFTFYFNQLHGTQGLMLAFLHECLALSLFV